MTSIFVFKTSQLSLILLLCIFQSSCIVGTVVGAVVDTTIEVVKIPFKVGGAVIDVITPDEFADDIKSSEDELDLDSDEASIQMEAQGL